MTLHSVTFNPMQNRLANSLRDTIKSDEALDLTKEWSQFGLEALISNDMLKHIPFLNTAVDLYKIGKSLRDRHLIKKIAVFLSRLAELSDDEKDTFIDEMSKHDKYGDTLCDKMLLILDKLDEAAKAEILGNLARMFAKRVISKDTFIRMTAVVERAVFYDLMVLHSHYKSYRFNETEYKKYAETAETRASLYNLGLFTLKLDVSPAVLLEKETDQPSAIPPDITFELNTLGQDLANLMFYDIAEEGFKKVMAKTKARNNQPPLVWPSVL